MRVAPSVRAVSMSGAAAVTTICSDAVACLSVMVRVWVCPTPRSSPFCTTVAKPASSALTSYGPSGSSTARKRPERSVTETLS